MDVEQPITTPTTNSGGDVSKNMLIMILLVILILSLLGINIFSIIGSWLQYIINIFNPVVSKGITDLEYASGTLLGKSSSIVADTSKTGIDILDGTVKSVGDLLLKASGQKPVSNTQPPTMAPRPPVPNDTTSPIQTSTSAPAKSKWCLVGEYNGKRGCVSISDQDKCLSGQVFPSQQLCLNPNLTQNSS
jgi:hypothetical protein